MGTTKAETRARIMTHLMGEDWISAGELAETLHLHRTTTRDHLRRMVEEGLVERDKDEYFDHDFAYSEETATHYRLLARPLGPPKPSDDRLCKLCVKSFYGDSLRYFVAFSRQPDHELEKVEVELEQRGLSENDDEWWVEVERRVRCARCGRARVGEL